MKRSLALCVSIALMLLTFASCSDAEKLTGFFIGTIKSISSENYVTVNVYEDYREVYGETVTVKGGGIKDIELCVGDELRVDPQKMSDDTVTAEKVKLLLCVDDVEVLSKDGRGSATMVTFDRVLIPKEFPDFTDPDLETTAESGNVFYWGSYRAVSQDKTALYLADSTEIKAQYVVFGDTTAMCEVGDFVTVTASAYKCHDYRYYAVDVEDITDICVLDSKKANASAVGPMLYDKPVIYLYPEDTVTVDVSLEVDGELTCTYPDYDGGKGWQALTVLPDGTVTKDGREYYCLYWEGEGIMEPDFSEGFCVKGGDTAEFLEKILKEIGLNDREANEFIIYWLPLLQKNKYNLISFQGQNYTDAAKLTVTPRPDSVLRVFMSCKPLEKPINIEPQTFEGFERNGFTVVEWGGGMAK